MANWSLPTTASTYVNYTSELDARLKDLAYGLDPAVTTASNILTNYVRWNSANNRWEKYNGTSWAALSTSYAISISGSASTLATARNIALSSDVTGSANFDGSANITITATLGTSGVGAGTYGSATQVAQVTFDAKGRATSASNVTVTPAWSSITSKPTTLSGFGITDAIQNAGTVPSFQSGLFASRPAAGTTGRFYYATDTRQFFRDNGSAWEAESPAYTGDVTKAVGDTVLSLSTTGVAAGTYGKVTVDTKGRVTAGSALTSSDITNTLGYTPASTTGSNATGTWTINISGSAASGAVSLDDTTNGWASVPFGYLNSGVLPFKYATYLSYYPGASGGLLRSGAIQTVNYVDCGTNILAGGSITAQGNITAYSDERLKKNWTDLGDDFVLKLAQVKAGVFERVDAEATQIGVGAQSLSSVMPQSVIEDEKGYLSVAYGSAALAACVMLAREIVALKQKLGA